MAHDDRAADPPQGFLTSDPSGLAARTTRAWRLFVDLIAEVDLAGPSRSARRSAREMVIGLGTWPDSRGIPELLADAHAGRTTCEPYRATSQRLAAAHADAADDDVRGSVAGSMRQTHQWLASGALRTEGMLLAPSPLGPLPLGTVVHAMVYQLAITARDLMPAGAPPLPELDELGLISLLDATGAVAARIGLVASAVAVGRRIAVSTSIRGGGWTSSIGDTEGPGVLGPEEVLLDLAGGRADYSALTRQVRFRDPRALLALSPVVDEIPDLPGGPLLRKTAMLARFLGRR